MNSNGGLAMLTANVKMLKKIILSLLLIFSTTTAYALRCGNDIVQTGDSQAKVLKLCDKPVMKNKVKKDLKFGNNSASISTVTQWTYNFGPNDFLYILSFENGKLVAISTDGYGYNE